MSKTVAIIGRPNVGKSTLFNRLIKKNLAIVDNTPGITRDRIEETARTYNNLSFEIIDTGGITTGKSTSIDKLVKLQAKAAIQKADLIIFLIDGNADITNEELFINKELKKSKKKILLVANKMEGKKILNDSAWKLGFKKIIQISAIHNINIQALEKQIVKELKISKQELVKEQPEEFKIVIIGKPNMGKSTLFNKIIRSNRSITSDQAQTTRDVVSSDLKINGIHFVISDTAGIIKKSKIKKNLEHYALIRVFKEIDLANLVLLLINPKLDVDHFEQKIASYIHKSLKPAIIVVNKSDLIKDDKENVQKEMIKTIKSKFKFLWTNPEVIFISALHNKNIGKLFKRILEIKQKLLIKIKTSDLNKLLLNISSHKPPFFNGGRLKISFINQVRGEIPTFVIFVNNKKFLHFSYQRFLNNQIIQNFKLTGIPIKLIFKNS